MRRCRTSLNLRTRGFLLDGRRFQRDGEAAPGAFVSETGRQFCLGDVVSFFPHLGPALLVVSLQGTRELTRVDKESNEPLPVLRLQLSTLRQITIDIWAVIGFPVAHDRSVLIPS